MTSWATSQKIPPNVAYRLFAAAAGLVMVAATLPSAPTIAMAVAAPAAMLVVLSAWIRSAAALAVLACVAVLALGEPSAVLASAAGLAATLYLLMIHAEATTTEQSLPTTWQTLFGAVGFACVGLAVVAVPLEVAWLPVLAPVVVVLLFALAIAPFAVASSSQSKDHVGQRR
ncbi:hypothetical protein ACHIPZ_14045 [Antrihabitans sp. NCIMB 15449]|jgi:hypothetical protein|uniref:Uncharacterized protein n=1 Tax=Antrihabitans spumae TaxID=3373370 RepID=A0ABW7JMU8_9NOCA